MGSRAAAGGGNEFAGLLPWSTFEEGRGFPLIRASINIRLA